MSYKHILIVLSLVFSLSLPLAAANHGALLFLTIEPGARANGMGRAYSAVADDAYGMWWNPGATAFNRGGQLAANHIPWMRAPGIDDMFYEYLGWNQYFEDVGNLNAHIVLLDAGEQDHTGTSGEDLGTFHTYDIAGAVGYSLEVIEEHLGIGGNFKLIYSYLAPGTGFTETDGKAFTFSFDLGAKYRKPFNIDGLDLSFVIQNIGPNVTYVDDEQKDPISMMVRAGAAYTVFDNPMNRLLFSVEAAKELANEDPLYMRFVTGFENMRETTFAAGAEYLYLNLIALRGGYFLDYEGDVKGPSFGVGLRYDFDKRYRLSADFAMIPGGGLIDFNKVFSLGFEF